MRRSRLAFALMAVVAIGITSCRKTGTAGGIPAEITNVRIGIPPGPLVGDDDVGRRDAMYKAGHWTPVLVTIQGRGQLENADLVVQTVDSDDVFNEYTVRLPVLEFTAEQPQYSVVAYARPGKFESPVTVSLRSRGQTVSFPEKTANSLELGHYLYVSLGARLSGLRLPGLDEKNSRRSEIGAIDVAGELPTRWIGYQSMDLAILSTSNDDFVNGLLNNAERRTALIEWVRRGGKLAITVSKNQGLLQNREDLKEFLPVDFTGSASQESIRVNWGSAVNDELTDTTRKTPVTIARVAPKADRNVRILTSAKTDAGQLPLVLEATYGLGRVTIVTLDPDQPPFTRWKHQGAFWTKLLQEAGPIFVESKNDAGAGFTDQASEDLAAQMQRSLESFDGVPVISFGWVALFILIYILVVGPLDYLFLKKVVKRLEWTWVTFPIVVVTVSIAAYLTAYSLKGNDQKINKIDLIDVDLNSRTVTGQSWFSVFSPRVQNYTLGIEPAEGWGIGRDPVSPPVLVSTGRTTKRSSNLFRRSYEFDHAVGGLIRVPVQVWSAKGFHATWQNRMDSGVAPIVTDLKSVGEDVTGSITSNLPVDLRQVTLFYRGKAYELDTLRPGAENRRLLTPAMRRSFDEWSRRNPGIAPPVAPTPAMRTPFAPPPPPPALEPTGNIIRTIMFHEAFETGRNRTVRNAGYRELDESWRIHADDAGGGAVLYATVDLVSGAANDVIARPATISRLWIGALPDGKSARPDLVGTLRQESHMRFFVPVKKAN